MPYNILELDTIRIINTRPTPIYLLSIKFQEEIFLLFPQFNMVCKISKGGRSWGMGYPRSQAFYISPIFLLLSECCLFPDSEDSATRSVVTSGRIWIWRRGTFCKSGPHQSTAVCTPWKNGKSHCPWRYRMRSLFPYTGYPVGFQVDILPLVFVASLLSQY